ncbi:MAG TPA: toll/interleukin-1 receptor domain-containing protein, partial [Blastocatellia bacterium]|nr:toll/interleukin-1 receptor domain-containing protein [Blastocatellia bacterium]
MACIFVSHAIGDSDIAGPLVDALEEFLEISRKEITCVGVAGCSQPTIGRLQELMLQEIESCKALFLILTRKSVGSPWVLGEAGAAWALRKEIVPILSHDLRDDEIPPFLSGHLFVRGDLTNVESLLPSLFGDLSTIIGVQKREQPRTEKLNLLISRLHSRISERPEPLLYKYGVGRFTANVYLGLLDGHDGGFTRESIQFAYNRNWKILPDPIEQKRDVWIKDMDQDARIHGKVFFNGPAIRLDSLDYNPHSGTEVKTPVLEFRPTCWHDYAISNKQIEESVLVPGKGLVSI